MSPNQSGEKAPPEPEEEPKPKKMVVQDKYNTEGGCRLILGSKEGVVRIFESPARVQIWNLILRRNCGS